MRRKEIEIERGGGDTTDVSAHENPPCPKRGGEGGRHSSLKRCRHRRAYSCRARPVAVGACPAPSPQRSAASRGMRVPAAGWLPPSLLPFPPLPSPPPRVPGEGGAGACVGSAGWSAAIVCLGTCLPGRALCLPCRAQACQACCAQGCSERQGVCARCSAEGTRSRELANIAPSAAGFALVGIGDGRELWTNCTKCLENPLEQTLSPASGLKLLD